MPIFSERAGALLVIKKYFYNALHYHKYIQTRKNCHARSNH